MARGERLRAPPSSLALFFSTTPAGGMHRAAPQDLVAQWAPCVPWERAGGLQVLDLAEQSQIGILGQGVFQAPGVKSNMAFGEQLTQQQTEQWSFWILG